MESISKSRISAQICSRLMGQRLRSDETDYVIRRLSPSVGGNLYLHLSDLLLGVRIIATNDQIKILDYGADLSPYRILFPVSEYRCADIEGPRAKDYLIDNNGRIKEQGQSFDLILSTQVLEHLPDPHTYFDECLRLLRPGGKLFMSTHGSFEDHAFPTDFQRWTAEGLKRDLQKAGFEVIAMYKMTSGPRAALHHIERCLETTFTSRKTVTGMVLWLMRSMHRTFRSVINTCADRVFNNYRITLVEELSGDLSNSMYIGLAAIARRPESSL